MRGSWFMPGPAGAVKRGDRRPVWQHREQDGKQVGVGAESRGRSSPGAA